MFICCKEREESMHECRIGQGDAEVILDSAWWFDACKRATPHPFVRTASQGGWQSTEKAAEELSDGSACIGYFQQLTKIMQCNWKS